LDYWKAEKSVGSSGIWSVEKMAVLREKPSADSMEQSMVSNSEHWKADLWGN
jgi:hypothetical protein